MLKLEAGLPKGRAERGGEALSPHPDDSMGSRADLSVAPHGFRL